MTDEDREEGQARDRARYHTEEYQAWNRARMAKTHSKAEHMAARNIEGIFDGTVIVPELKDTKDSIGSMSHPCSSCGRSLINVLSALQQKFTGPSCTLMF